MLYARRNRLSQNFLRSSQLVANLVKNSSLGKNDLVLEIGPGRGIITEQLLAQVQHVIAIELDSHWYHYLLQRFSGVENLTLYQGDFLSFNLPKTPYKVFANLPFNITAAVITKLLSSQNPPTEAYLAVQKEAAEKFTGFPHETQFSVLAKPCFEFEIVYNFHRSDFTPEPRVETVLLKITRRGVPLVPKDQELQYKNFIKFAFNTWKKDLKSGLSSIFTYRQWKRLAHDNNFSVHAKPTDLNFTQWLNVFTFSLTRKVPLINSK